LSHAVGGLGLDQHRSLQTKVDPDCFGNKKRDQLVSLLEAYWRDAPTRENLKMFALHCLQNLHGWVLPVWLWLKVSLFEPYRPELHYMRGPGPKWREKHGRSIALAS
jgi:hypothetical protein